MPTQTPLFRCSTSFTNRSNASLAIKKLLTKVGTIDLHFKKRLKICFDKEGNSLATNHWHSPEGWHSDRCRDLHIWTLIKLKFCITEHPRTLSLHRQNSPQTHPKTIGCHIHTIYSLKIKQRSWPTKLKCYKQLTLRSEEDKSVQTITSLYTIA